MKIDEPLFYTSKTIAELKEPELIRIPTGLSEIDKKIIGLNKGEVSVVSGSRSSAKSTVLSQIAINMVNNGYKVALFSGELKASRILTWIHLQAAGRYYTKSTDYENYYTVPEDIQDKINKWLEQKLFVYNNNYGKKAQGILDAVEYCINKKGIDIVILDNLMSIDLDSTQFNKNEKQSSFVQTIIEFAKKYNVHIILVAHPRKAMGFLRIDDISGTADLSNAADNVFIIHRVNSDFERLSKLTLGLKADNPIYTFDNVIEICKNRDLGHQDVMIGLYFEIESKRMSCYKENNRIYGWVTQPVQQKEPEISIDLTEIIPNPFEM
jgi:KaiC/GvpD/RAD55 family RecA-like ATPase